MVRFLIGQLHVLRPRADLGRVLLAFAPLLGAALIAISRCEDYRHDVYDVSIGSLLGISLAYFSYRRYFPHLRSFRCHLPYPSRAAADAAAAASSTQTKLSSSSSASGEGHRRGSRKERRSSDDDSSNRLPDAEMLPLQPFRRQPESSVHHHRHNNHDHDDDDDGDGDDRHDLERGNYYSATSLSEYHRETDS